MHANWYVYKITYPNGKIYIGIDFSKTPCPWQYLGSSTNQQLQIDCDNWRKKYNSWEIQQEILFESTTCTVSELRKIEQEQIIAHQANHPKIGYNLRT